MISATLDLQQSFATQQLPRPLYFVCLLKYLCSCHKVRRMIIFYLIPPFPSEKTSPVGIRPIDQDKEHWALEPHIHPDPVRLDPGYETSLDPTIRLIRGGVFLTK